MNTYTSRALVGVIFIGTLFGTVHVASAACSPTLLTPVAFGQKGKSVTRLQECMAEFGYSNQAGATGYYGVQTQAAVARFYAAMTNVKSDGKRFGAVGVAKMKEVVALRKGQSGSSSGSGIGQNGGAKDSMKKVASSTELRDYFSQASTYGYWRGGGIVTLQAREMVVPTMANTAAPAMGDSAKSVSGGSGVAANRVSETNVQVVGVDEPDIVKTNGSELFYSMPSWYMYARPMTVDVPASTPTIGGAAMPMQDVAISSRMVAPPAEMQGGVRVVDALPAESVAQIATIPTKNGGQGEMLFVKPSTLVVFRHDGMTAYSTKDPKNPKEVWSSAFSDNNSLVQARLYNNKIYLVTQQWQGGGGDPCPIVPFVRGALSTKIMCTDIWRPTRLVQADSLYSVLEVNPLTGSVDKKTAFVGSGSATVYMSTDNLYVAYQTQESEGTILAKLVTTDAASLFPSSVVSRVKEVLGMNLGETAKDAELRETVEKYYRTLSNDARLTLETQLANVQAEFMKKNKREFEKTLIAKIPLNTFTVSSSGSVPGYLVNQFALDEHKGFLRVATTVGGRWFGRGQSESENDVYVLNPAMNTVGRVQGLGLTERIYSARFIGDKGYLVTFRQIDPFYVLDLSVPSSPKVAGELKIPGFSSYLHPLSDSWILGVGQEEGKVKLSLFDVSNPRNPTEISKYFLSEGWTEVQNNHRAFLHDAAHDYFFIPGGQGGYIIGYAGGKLDLKKAVDMPGVQRAIYINTSLYMLGTEGMSVWNIRDWSKQGEMKWGN